jgi:hypothetical protein
LASRTSFSAILGERTNKLCIKVLNRFFGNNFNTARIFIQLTNLMLNFITIDYLIEMIFIYCFDFFLDSLVENFPISGYHIKDALDMEARHEYQSGRLGRLSRPWGGPGGIYR